MELPKDKQPPKELWFKNEELEDWFDRIYSNGEKQTEFNLPLEDSEIEDT
jgi:hypothetical protein